MTSTEKEVCMDQYWNYVATPLFIFVLLFGLFVLFRVSGTQLVASGPIAGVMAAIRKPLRGYTGSKPVAAGPLVARTNAAAAAPTGAAAANKPATG
jgi:hypothetical protein